MALIDTAGGVSDLSGFVRRGQGTAEADFVVKGARCAGCLGKIERGVLALPGVASCRLNLSTGRLHVAWEGSKADPRRILSTVEDLGYACAPFDPGQGQKAVDREGRELALALGVAGFGAANVMMFTVPVWAGLFGQELGEHSRQTLYWLSAIVATPCALYAGRPFYRSAFAALRRGHANMDVPITLGVGLALVMSFYETWRGAGHAYFDAAVSLIFLLLIGRFLDHRLRRSARSAASDLLALQAPVAQVLDGQGVVHGMPVSQVRPGDRLVIQPGERVPVDATLVEGASEIDLSLVTGESRPEATAVGMRLAAGVLVLNGKLVVQAASGAEDSSLADLARLMEAGAQAKTVYTRLADRAAALYIPVVHTLAVLTLVLGWALTRSFETGLIRASAVLIVTCPCALGLAVPAVQVAASARLFRRGVLVKSGAALERLAEVDSVVFDKTGVLTDPTPEVGDLDPGVLGAAAELARASRHPLCRALAVKAGTGVVAKGVVETAGQGLEGEVGGRRARLGRAGFVGSGAVDGPETELWFAYEGEPAIRIVFSERLRPGAVEIARQLAKRGLQMRILSGDRSEAVERVAAAVGIDHWRASLTPQEKLGEIEAQQRGGRKVLMIGDGLNDAAALAVAHASMAPGEASEVSQNAADLVFTGGDLRVVGDALGVARQARAMALQNFAFSALYNAVAIPAAMAGMVTPLFAALAMSGSSLVVMGNAARLTLFRRQA